VEQKQKSAKIITDVFNVDFYVFTKVLIHSCDLITHCSDMYKRNKD